MTSQSTIGRSQKETPRRRGWLPYLSSIVLALLSIVVGVAAGVALTLLFFDRTSDEAVPAEPEIETPLEGSVEAGFARDMMVHHAQAVEMSEIVRDRTEDEEIRNLAAKIALAQQTEIGQMRGWLEVWGLPPTGTEPAMSWMSESMHASMGHSMDGAMPGMASPKEIDTLQTAPPEEMDIRFLQLMIPHHEAALPMAQDILERTDRPEVKRLATAIVASQQAEIRLMQNFLQKRGVPVQEGSSISEGFYGGD